jgi:hypothetical protein
MSEAWQPTSELPFRVRLVSHLGLPGVTYARDHYFGQDHYTEPEFVKKWDAELVSIAIRAVEEGDLTGGLGLEFIEDALYLRHSGATKLAYHGSPFNLDKLEPRQAIWNDPDPTKPYRYADGQPALCVSRTTKFPAMRALLHEAHPEVAAQPWYLSKRTDARFRPYWFTSEETLDSLKSEGTQGFVCALDLAGGEWMRGSKVETDVVYDRGRDEYRIFSSRQPLLKVTVGAEALPPDLCVIPADDRWKLGRLSVYDNVRAWGDAERVAVRPLGGLWDISFAPY